ncbi:acyl-[acyl-carrier-protein]--UDP-N-acetylglucosamine O-acyltransferase [Psychromonas sp. MB-3u-54]|uniref:acyl-ACP--UDP-N-acetylglucosamine O-acyltransferase n=1 Tax=Psychromonas sp. MB-3u-54 TaxID=2058319 RepID=UPI000C326036|nr:acyl-ACP--UDP-N-acetylglucosamine O-acyltransferase [Psychromonas sp. MB-3u-54]PKH04341.1 acyl-[acyl-carrier-protein]--UDP-N-acetylglucosamine O-acyltransferase [Psychromonas sp. MB-3u-54]
MTKKIAMIHPTAIVHENAIIGKDVEIGPYTIIGDRVEIGDNCWIAPHVVIKGPTKMGKGNKIYQFASIGEDCQDLKYNGEETFLEIGDNNVFRESCTIHRGTAQDQGTTRIGNHNLLMAYVHVAHDCVLGDNIILSNNATLAGHTKIANNVIIGGLSALHQFTRVGEFAMIGGCSAVNKDIPPYFMATGNYVEAQGVNSVGLKRSGFDSKAIMEIKRAYKILCREGNTLAQAKLKIAEKLAGCPELQVLYDFICEDSRGIVR